MSLTVRAGSVTALLGPNGAGKSTVARVATGLVPVTSGRILLDGEDVTGLPTWRLVRRGVAHAPEGRSVFATLDVEDNLRLTFLRSLGRREAGRALERSYERFPGLAERRRQLAGTLSGGEQRMLALARVLAVPPKVLVVDELSLGLAPRVVDDVFHALREIRDAGTSLLVIEQQVPARARARRGGRDPPQGRGRPRRPDGRARRARLRAAPGRRAARSRVAAPALQHPAGVLLPFSKASRVQIVDFATSQWPPEYTARPTEPGSSTLPFGLKIA